MACAADGGVFLYDVRTEKLLARLDPGPAHAAFFRPSGDSLIVVTEHSLQHWPLSMPHDGHGPIHVGPPDEIAAPVAGPLYSASIDERGRKLAVADFLQKVIIVDLDAPADPVILAGHPGVSSVALSPDGRWAATATFKGLNVMVWDLNAKKIRPVATLSASDRAAVSFSPEGRWLLVDEWVQSRRDYYSVGSWELARQEPINAGDTGWAFAHDGMMAVTCQAGRAVRLLDLPSGTTRAVLPDLQRKHLTFVSLSPDGSRLVAGEHYVCNMWDLCGLRTELSKIGLDWDAPAFAATAPTSPEPLEVSVDDGRSVRPEPHGGKP
jgi:WD40 repeat protein